MVLDEQRERTVNSLYCRVNPLRQCSLNSLHLRQHVPNITLTRRQNAMALFQAYAEKALATGTSPKGLEQAFAATLQVSPSMWSQIKSARPIGDKLARQIEQAHQKPSGWLDEARKDVVPSVAEAAFLELALAAWRSTNSAGRKGLREHLKSVVSEARP